MSLSMQRSMLRTAIALGRASALARLPGTMHPRQLVKPQVVALSRRFSDLPEEAETMWCPCGEMKLEIKRVVKDNENHGRPFIGCECERAFFAWTDEKVIKDVCSGHEKPVKIFTVRKENENFGRRFMSCGMPTRCNHFVWLDEPKAVTDEPKVVKSDLPE
mmetsp:Transcript_6557/g.15167  ORF Transcript_6557/g.15167 Transcript_6557/m.15167 type:complete len:161 (+) Transcript_6557:2-484(+)